MIGGSDFVADLLSVLDILGNVVGLIIVSAKLEIPKFKKKIFPKIPNPFEPEN